MPILVSGVQYSGIWTMQQVNAAIAAGTWPLPPYMYSWGLNNTGQLGTGNITSYSSPKQVGSSARWTTGASGGYWNVGRTFVVAIKSDNSLWSWGGNTKGQLGLGNRTDYSSPKQVGSLTTWSSVSAGGGYSSCFAAAIKSDGTLWVWGDNIEGQLGLGNRTSYSSPKQVGALTNWSKVSCGAYYQYTAAVKTDGTLWSWGYNFFGQLGLGNTTSYSSPKQVGSLTNWLSVATGYATTWSIKTNGTLWSWGYNANGELGIGNTTDYSSPKQIGALTNWLSVTCGYNHALAIKTDGTLWAWGRNIVGNLGTGNITNYSSPKQIGALTTWSKTMLTGNYASFAIKTDGTLWSWGLNSNGQLGLNNRTYYSSPKQVGSLTTWYQVFSGSESAYAINQ